METNLARQQLQQRKKVLKLNILTNDMQLKNILAFLEVVLITLVFVMKTYTVPARRNFCAHSKSYSTISVNDSLQKECLGGDTAEVLSNPGIFLQVT